MAVNHARLNPASWCETNPTFIDGGACHVQMYLVGDPAQLPATVMSERAVAHGYTRSMFQRLQASGHPVQASLYCPCVSCASTCLPRSNYSV